MTAAAYPVAASEAVSTRMRRNRSADTKLELTVRSALHRSGLRFRKGLRIYAGDVSVRPDIVFTRARVAVFLDGCFWHGCPEHGTRPRHNEGYWSEKLSRNAARDRAVTQALRRDGWTVIRRWEHEPAEAVVHAVRQALARANSTASR
jgi:DNA mismatch endonuclease (patch repair protein)